MSVPVLVSTRTRDAFREVLVGWTLAEIATEFHNEGFTPNYAYNPQLSGQRWALVEQLYHGIDFSYPRQATRLLKVCQTVLLFETHAARYH